MVNEFDKKLEDCVVGEVVTELQCGTFGENEVYYVVKKDPLGKKYLEKTGHSGNLVDNR